MTLLQEQELEIDRCPHCSVARPRMPRSTAFDTKAHTGKRPRHWVVYVCATCGGAVLTACTTSNPPVISEIYPKPASVDKAIPEKARSFLSQAIASLHAPAGAVMLAASAVDAMLKAKGKATGSLYSRIDASASEHLITEEMAEWAHEVRLEANDQRHADDEAALPSEADATRVIEFATALGEFMFVLPHRIQEGRAKPGTNART